MRPLGDAEWIARFQAVGRAQARYLWLFLVFGVFYFAVDAQVRVGP